MANRRTLKKNIHYICSELFAECVAASHYKVNTDPKELDDVMRRILEMHDDFIRRISHTEPGSTELFYKKLKADFNAQTDQIVSTISRLC